MVPELAILPTTLIVEAAITPPLLTVKACPDCELFTSTSPAEIVPFTVDESLLLPLLSRAITFPQTVGTGVAVFVGVFVPVEVKVAVAVTEAVDVFVAVAVEVAVTVMVAVSVLVGVAVAEPVRGGWQVVLVLVLMRLLSTVICLAYTNGTMNVLELAMARGSLGSYQPPQETLRLDRVLDALPAACQ
jgi:hypothetical protein